MAEIRRIKEMELLANLKVSRGFASLISEPTGPVETIFSREISIAEAIKGFIGEVEYSVDAAVHRLNSGELFECLLDARYRGIEVRLLTDWSKYQQNEFTRTLLSKATFPWRLSRGRGGTNSKMHHKFLILDQSIILTGSYNWTLASETQNFENIVVLRGTDSVKSFCSEFEALWENEKLPPQ